MKKTPRVALVIETEETFKAFDEIAFELEGAEVLAQAPALAELLPALAALGYTAAYLFEPIESQVVDGINLFAAEVA
jgi:hypothetical protein